jgi:DNA-binding NarL/FixJ family response regulator
MQIETASTEIQMCRGGLFFSPLAATEAHIGEVEVITQGTMQVPKPAADQPFDIVGPREQQIIELLLQGCDNSEIARDLNMAERTVKAHFNRLFLRFGIKGGIKRVKLATLLYRRQLWLEKQQSTGAPANANNSSFRA